VFAVFHEPTFYFDDSGGKDTGISLFAGFVSTERKWSRFEREWVQAVNQYPELRRENATLGGYLHMKEFMNDPHISDRREIGD
jgi:hypothetical protein